MRFRKLRSVGAYARVVMEMVIPAILNSPAVGLNWSETEIEAFIAQCKRSLEDTSIHSYMYFYCWYGQRPL
jgi:hypothetical protein